MPENSLISHKITIFLTNNNFLKKFSTGRSKTLQKMEYIALTFMLSKKGGSKILQILKRGWQLGGFSWKGGV